MAWDGLGWDGLGWAVASEPGPGDQARFAVGLGRGFGSYLGALWWQGWRAMVPRAGPRSGRGWPALRLARVLHFDPWAIDLHLWVALALCPGRCAITGSGIDNTGRMLRCAALRSMLCAPSTWSWWRRGDLVLILLTPAPKPKPEKQLHQ